MTVDEALDKIEATDPKFIYAARVGASAGVHLYPAESIMFYRCHRILGVMATCKRITWHHKRGRSSQEIGLTFSQARRAAKIIDNL